MYILSSGLDNKILNALRMEKMELTEQNCVVSEANHLRKRMMQDLLAADLQLSLFVGASQSFKYESLLKPVPNHFKKADGEVDIDKLRKLILKLPRLDCDNINKFDSDIVGLLKTVLLSSSYKLASIPLNTFKAQLSMKIDLKILPKWIFQVDYAPSRQESWERSKSGRNVFFAYHGSRYENFHSILSLGLHQHLNKTSLFGEGIYLSTEQTLSMHYSPSGAGWCLSQLGQELSILALCEVVDHPDVKRETRPDQRNSLIVGQNGVPEKYILVTNNELVRPRYLLVYTRPKVQRQNSSSFWHRHKFVLCIGIYLVLLLAIGLAKRSSS